MVNNLLHISEEIQHALQSKQPIVALESPQSLNPLHANDAFETAMMVEKIIRSLGAVPAPIGLYNGKIHIGLNESIFHELASQPETMRASRRDIPFFLSRKLTASTTIAATMFCAHLAKLAIFVTGGIGGVHHHVQESFDISADLIELASTPITVVCSGAKSILDLPKTLEMLETHGVSVIGYQTNEFPAFFSHSSGIPLLNRLDTTDELADLMVFQQKLNTTSGLIVANPIPKSAEIPDEQILPAIKKAQQELQDINGHSITPFLLQRIAELTRGQSIKAHSELIKCNAKLGAQIAIAYQQRINQG